MKKSLLLVLLVLALSISTVAGDDDVLTLTADLHGVNEVPAINSNATASFKATIDENGSITFTETFQNLTSNAILSHIHFGKNHVAGGVMIFLCGGGGQPACPVATSLEHSKASITPANVTGPTTAGHYTRRPGQRSACHPSGCRLREFALGELPGGEVRGQVIVHHGEDRNDR